MTTLHLIDVITRLRRKGRRVVAVMPHPISGVSSLPGVVVELPAGCRWTMDGTSYRSLPEDWAKHPHEAIADGALLPGLAEVERAREQAGVSIAELARRAHMHRSKVAEILGGKRRVYADELARLAGAVGLTVRLGEA